MLVRNQHMLSAHSSPLLASETPSSPKLTTGLGFGYRRCAHHHPHFPGGTSAQVRQPIFKGVGHLHEV
jgi:hypothetical protein